MNIFFRTFITTVITCSTLSGCNVENKTEEKSPLVGTFNVAVEDEYAAELILRSDGVFTYARVGKNINDRTYGQWGFTDKTVYLNAVKNFPESWGSPTFTMLIKGRDLIAKIDNEDVEFEQTANYNDIMQSSEALRQKVENR